MWRRLRIAVLLFVLLNVALGSWLARVRSTDWDRPLHVAVHVIDGDGSVASRAALDQLLALDRYEQAARFDDIEAFFAREAGRLGLALEHPVEMVFAGETTARPPSPPAHGSWLAIAAWSLHLRWWAWRHDDYPYLKDADLYVLYHDPGRSPRLAHSLGLAKGLVGVVNVFAAARMRAENHVIMAHELLHLVGASDKYDPATNLPRYPDGYAEPAREPLLPQESAEIMAGRIAVSEQAAVAPQGFDEVTIGTATAREIGWLPR